MGSEPLFISEVGPVIGAHTGPGLLGVGGVPKKYLEPVPRHAAGAVGTAGEGMATGVRSTIGRDLVQHVGRVPPTAGRGRPYALPSQPIRPRRLGTPG